MVHSWNLIVTLGYLMYYGSRFLSHLGLALTAFASKAKWED